MTEIRRSRYLVLVVLAVIGVSLAGVGSVLGVTQPLTHAGSSAEFIVTEDNITIEGGGESETIVSNMTYVRDVSIEASDDGHFTINTSGSPPLTPSERKRAEELAVQNDTVRTGLTALEDYRVAVSPVEKINASSFETGTISATESEREGNESTFVIQTNATTSGEYNRSVSIQREPIYVEDRATVMVYRLGSAEDDELKYSIDVDLANETVVDITDWDRARGNAETVTVTEEDSVN